MRGERAGGRAFATPCSDFSAVTIFSIFKVVALKVQRVQLVDSTGTPVLRVWNYPNYLSSNVDELERGGRYGIVKSLGARALLRVKGKELLEAILQ